METLALIILVVFLITGFAAIFFTTFGTLIMMAGSVLYAYLTSFQILTPKVLLVLLLLYLLGELLEFMFTMVGAKAFGASNAAAFGAVAGGILGAIIGTSFFGVGLIVGTFCGIFLGAFLVEHLKHKEWRRSVKAGIGSLVGRVGSIFTKVCIALVMVVIIVSRIVAAI
ncbi:MAG: DUF456 domain-containing protein [Candidatus Omnitrophica bacterium]|nr:DUF456 domain-containing protein [Candidatus Omnitrophota bacterium]